jgi:xanthine dehydrogenase small subunit
VGVQVNKGLRELRSVLLLSDVPELKRIERHDNALIFGAAASIADVERTCRDALPEYARLLSLFGSPPIRNAGTIGGNIANGSPIGDSMPALFVLDAEVELRGLAGTRRVNMNAFYSGYRRTVARPDELITAVHVPLPMASDIFRLYKVSRRKDLDISAFTAAIWMRRDGEMIREARIAYGGVGPTILRLPNTEAFFIGKALTAETVRQAGLIARDEIAPISDVRGSAEYRRQLGQNVLRKFYAELTLPSNGNGPHFAGSRT